MDPKVLPSHTKYNGNKTYKLSDDFEGVSHGDDTFYYLFVQQLSSPKLNEQDEKMKNLYLDMIVSFARDG